MSTAGTRVDGDVVTTAAVVASTTAARVGVVVQELELAADTGRAAALLQDVWLAPSPPVQPQLVRAIQLSGGYAFGAFDAVGALVGVSVALLGLGPSLHSHITGVARGHQRGGIGLALKQHQRAWALERGIVLVTWTCDPLIGRNLAFNLHALGAVVAHYLPDHYGPMADGVNEGDETDRLEVHWHLTSARAAAAATARLAPVDAVLPFAVESGASGPVDTGLRRGPRAVALPDDAEALRAADPAAARAWRRAVRDAVLPAVAEGLVIAGLDRRGAIALTEETP